MVPQTVASSGLPGRSMSGIVWTPRGSGCLSTAVQETHMASHPVCLRHDSTSCEVISSYGPSLQVLLIERVHASDRTHKSLQSSRTLEQKEGRLHELDL